MIHALKKASSWLALVVLASLSSQAFAQLDKKGIERIEVLGQQTMPQLERAFEQQRFAFLELYNSINEVAKFDMICSTVKQTGSQIARKECEPRYLKSFRALMVQAAGNTSTNNSRMSIDLGRLASNDDLAFLIKETREESHEHVAALIATHPELFESFVKLDAINQKIKQRKEDNN